MLGPLPNSDPRFMRRIRVHQAWYRVCVLGLAEFGNLAVSGAPCGSVLPDLAAQAFRNFHGANAIYRYLDRRRKGWGVDPVRCTKYLTSSQTLTFNMLAEVVSRPWQCAALFNQLMDRKDLAWMEEAEFEFAAQGSEYSLGDNTLLDVMLRFRTVGGGMQVVAVETKLADRFCVRRTSAMTGERYRGLAGRSELWSDLGSAFASNKARQLARCHALAESIQAIDAPSGGHAALLVMTHPEDDGAGSNVSDYKSHLADPDSVTHRSWSDYLRVASATGALGASLVHELSRRYVDLHRSEDAWQETRQASRAPVRQRST